MNCIFRHFFTSSLSKRQNFFPFLQLHLQKKVRNDKFERYDEAEQNEITGNNWVSIIILNIYIYIDMFVCMYVCMYVFIQQANISNQNDYHKGGNLFLHNKIGRNNSSDTEIFFKTSSFVVYFSDEWHG